MTFCSASRYSSRYWPGSKSMVMLSISDSAMASSWGRTGTSSSRNAKSGARTSSGHTIVSSTSTLSRTRSVPSDSRLRMATFTSATMSERCSASRSSAYGLTATPSGSR